MHRLENLSHIFWGIAHVLAHATKDDNAFAKRMTRTDR